MTAQPPHVESQPGADPGSPPGMPRWVKAAAIVVGLLILLFVVLQVSGVAGQHGPGRHMSGSAPLGVGVTDGASSPDELP